MNGWWWVSILAALVVIVGVRWIQHRLRQRKKALQLQVDLKSADNFARIVHQRNKHTLQVLEKGKFRQSILPNRVALTNNSNDWETCYDLNPLHRNSNWVAMSEYVSALSIHNPDARQAVAETILEKIQCALFGQSLPIPLSWILPSHMRQGDLPLHALQVLQLSVINAPGIPAAIANVKNFIRQELRENVPPSLPPLHQYFPARCELAQAEEIMKAQPKKIPTKKSLQPVNKKLLPGLCKGWAPHHLPAFSGDPALRNQAYKEIMNRLSYNYALDLELPCPRDVAQRFVLVMPDGTEITRAEDLVAYLIDHGCQVKMEIRVASAVMGFNYSLSRAAVGQPPEGEKEYFDVPFAFFARTGVHSQKYNAEAVMPLLHSGINLICEGELEGVGDVGFQVQFYMQMGECVQYNVRNSPQDLIEWNPGRIVDRWTERDQLVRGVRLSALYACILNGIGKRDNLESGGYGLLGVCSDAVAPIQHCLSGRTTVYPILATGQYRIAIIKECFRLERDYAPTLSDDEIQGLRDLAKAVRVLPNDNYQDPDHYLDSLQRIEASLPYEEGEEPFSCIVMSRKIVRAEIQACEDTFHPKEDYLE